MPLFAIYAVDRPGASAIRAANRDAHLAYSRQLGDRLLIGGPMLAEDGTMTGSLIIAEFDDLAAAESHAANDPYSRADLFEYVRIAAWRKVLP